MMLITYPALVYAATDDEAEFLIHFPDWGGCSIHATTLAKALQKAQQVLLRRIQMHLTQQQGLPKATPLQQLSLKRDNPLFDCVDFKFSQQRSFITAVQVTLPTQAPTHITKIILTPQR